MGKHNRVGRESVLTIAQVGTIALLCPAESEAKELEYESFAYKRKLSL